MEKKILVVDDEESVVKSISGVLEDEGFGVIKAKSGEEALVILREEDPPVTLLDIWMPGIDGIEVLKRIKLMAPECQVIMLSGHATISTAMAAVKLGAFDFIEKPLSLDVLLQTVRRALASSKEFPAGDGEAEDGHDLAKNLLSGEEDVEDVSELPLSSFSPAAVLRKTAKRKSTPLSLQRTLKTSKVLYGTGLHSGMKTGLLLQPLPVNSGILFGNLSSDDIVPLHVDYVQTTDMATALKKGLAVAKTIEHLMAVLHAYRITNLMVKMIEEIPIMDGSALEFCNLIEEAGVEYQEEKAEELIINRPYEISKGNKSLIIEPAEVFSVTYHMDYPPPIGKQTFHFVLDNEESFKNEVAPARTFGFLKDMEMLERLGLGEGGRLNNFILVDDEKVVNTELRFPDEFVRHKILDLIGDFYLLNRPIQGKVTARLTGHTDNVAMMKKIFAETNPSSN
ncbi:MAG TPA: UDP-3-O-acyl-N-acetylglucosamine deacetylase [Thermodesulfobacteriota bacterium]|nr:UDP-3-O-acyl-N-acetylglucosamine deacetylase [Thermodesulfobacteriota bacterium]